jgi:4-hydroxybenzoate polyprenyltransferase
MLGAVTGATAYGLGATPGRAGLAGLLGLLCSLGGFLLDDVLDRERDRVGGVTRNLVASGMLSPGAALGVAIGAFAVAAVAGAFLAPYSLLPMLGILALLILPALGIAGGPVARAASLGALQALYATIGGVFAGASGPALPLIAAFLFFAMTGGRVLGDVRDMPADLASRLPTIPIRYGMRFAGVFLVANELVAYGCAVAAGVSGRLGYGYLVCVLLIAVAGTGINVIFVRDPTPCRADFANRLSLGLLGGLYTLGMLLAGS